MWVFAISIHSANLKGVSSLKLHRDLKVTLKTVRFMLHRQREAGQQELDDFQGQLKWTNLTSGVRKATNMLTRN